MYYHSAVGKLSQNQNVYYSSFSLTVALKTMLNLFIRFFPRMLWMKINTSKVVDSVKKQETS